MKKAICMDCAHHNPLYEIEWIKVSSTAAEPKYTLREPLDKQMWPEYELNAYRFPDPMLDDYICSHFTPEYWESKGYRRNWGDAAVMNWPHLEILRREKDNINVDYVILSPFSTRRPIVINNSVQEDGNMWSWGGY